MIQNALLEMQLFDSAKETDNKLRWDAYIDGTKFSLYIPKWRVPEPWPSRVWINVVLNRSNADDPPNMTPADVNADPTIRHEPLIASIDKFREHTQTTRYRPTGDPSAWEIGEPYIPFAMTFDGADRLRMIIHWDVTSRGLFHSPIANPV